MDAASCIFCKIAAGQIPTMRVLEARDAVAFLDIGPLAPGHLLLIPKTHYTSIVDVPPPALSELVSHLPGLARAVLQVTGASGLNILQNTGESSGQAVFHLHFHLIPRIAGDRLGYRWDAGSYSAGQGEALQGRMVEVLKGRV
jgi:histidine triad (HIT) family protein